jgi:hypothetical protein
VADLIFDEQIKKGGVAAAEMQARVSPPLLKNDRCEGEI